MDRFRNRFLAQVQVLQDQLESLLSQDWGPRQSPDASKPFEVQTDLNQLETLGWSLPTHEPDRSQVLFDRLAPYFETGFCFHLESKRADSAVHWRLESAFHQGNILPLLPEDREKRVSFPSMTLTEVRRISAEFLLRELKFPTELGFDRSALVIHPSDQRLWILFSGLPDVFLKPHLTAIQETCLKLLADFPDEGDT
jgi:hypothetical protein